MLKMCVLLSPNALPLFSAGSKMVIELAQCIIQKGFLLSLHLQPLRGGLLALFVILAFGNCKWPNWSNETEPRFLTLMVSSAGVIFDHTK